MHHTAERIENSLRGEVLGGDQIDEMLLAVFFLELVSVTAPRSRSGLNVPSGGCCTLQGRIPPARRRESAATINIASPDLSISIGRSSTFCCASGLDDATPRTRGTLGMSTRAETATDGRILPRETRARRPQRARDMMAGQNFTPRRSDRKGPTLYSDPAARGSPLPAGSGKPR